VRRVILNLRIALRSLYNFKLRTSLAVLGVFLGTFSLIVVSNLTGSLTIKAQMEIDNLGKNMLVVASGTVRTFGGRARLLSQATTLTLADARTIAAESPFISQVSPSSSKTFAVRYEEVVLKSILVTGVSPNYPSVRNYRVREGSFFTEDDDRNSERVAVIGKEVADKLFGNKSPLGRFILIYRVPCQVIGVLEEKGVDLSGANQDNQIFIPLKTFLRRFVNKDFINSIYLQTVDSRSLAPAKTQIERILRHRHNIKAGEKDDFTVVDSKDVMQLKTQATSMITVLGRISAAISYTIGAIGILSIMILIVNERKVEIGIRRAVGSRKRDIILQFLIESSFISLSGGAVGVVFGFFISLVIFRVSKLPFTLSLTGFISSFIASVTVGILAGIYPSKKATTIQPVDVIRA